MSEPYTLLVDLGNTRLKWALESPRRWLGGFAADVNVGMVPDFDRLWHDLGPPARMMVANVRGAAAEAALIAWCTRRWAVVPRCLNPAVPVAGIANGYRDPAQLGPDRWAAVIGAHAVGSLPVVVVDCGTAITIDVVDQHSRYLGGAIMPGLELAWRSLHDRTEQIVDGAADCRHVLGRSTAECVASGVFYGLVGGVERVIEEAGRSLGALANLLLTGGDALRVQPFLKRPAMVEPDLVLRGLAEVMRRDEVAVRDPDTD